MELLIQTLVTWAFSIVVNKAVRSMVGIVGLDSVRERMAQMLEARRGYRKSDALRRKQIVDTQIIRYVDSAVISDDVKKMTEETMGRWGLIKKQWNDDLSTPYTFEWRKFFSYSATWTELVAHTLAELYKEQNIACLAILSCPRTKKTKATDDFDKALENALGSRKMGREWITYGMIERKHPPRWIDQLREGEGILILQPMAMNDDYVQKTVDYINTYSEGSIVEVITLFDGSGRGSDKKSKNPPERVLIELNLSQ